MKPEIRTLIGSGIAALSLSGCSVPEVELYPLQVYAAGLQLDPVAVKIQQIVLERCTEAEPDTVKVRRRFTLTNPRPFFVPDRRRCGLLVTLSEGFLISGETYSGTRFSYTLPPQTVARRQEFSAGGALLAMVLDPALLLAAEEIDAAVEDQVSLRPVIARGADSPESAALSLRLPDAIWVGTLEEGYSRFGPRWPYPPEIFLTGVPIDSADSADSRPDSSADSADSGRDSLDTARAAWRLDTGSGGGCGGSGAGDSSESVDSADSASVDKTDDTAKDLDSSGDEGGGCGCGGSGDDSGDDSGDSGDDSGDSTAQRGPAGAPARGTGGAAMLFGAWALRRQRGSGGQGGGQGDRQGRG